MAHLFQVNLGGTFEGASRPINRPFLRSFIHRRKTWSFRFCFCAVLGTIAFLAFPAFGGQTNRALLKISGYGFLGNRELKRMLMTLELGGKKPPFFDATFVEDAALLLSARVKRDGYLAPVITLQLRLENGGGINVEATDLLENPLPRPLRVAEARFKIRKGVLFHYKQIQFEGLKSLEEKDALGYFVETGALFQLKHGRIYTPEKLRQGLSSLTDVLERQGYEQPRAGVGH